MKDHASIQGRPPIDLMEESCHLLRRVPVSCLAAYFIGVVPFMLGFLYFISDMSRSPFAAGRIGVASLGLALLFFWMKAWQTVYADRLLNVLSGATPAPWTFARILRMLSLQVFIQPLGFLLLPLSLLILMPFAWVFAFFANTTVLGSGCDPLQRNELARIWRQSLLWPRQNHVLLLAFKLFFIFILFNLTITVAGLPWLLKMLLGIETVFTLSPWSIVNTTFAACVLVLAYLCVDPLIKATYVLRCFYGESLQSGLDLKVDLAPFRRVQARVALLMWLALFSLPAIAATTPPSPAAPARIDSVELENSMREVIQKRQYSWRLPREGAPDEETDASTSALTRFFESLARGIGEVFKMIGTALRDLINWLRIGQLGPAQTGGPGYDWYSPLRFLLLLLIAVLAVMLGVLLYRAWKKRHPTDADADGISREPATPDVSDENVGADQLPDDEWLQLARQLLLQGDRRLAMRAFYLASLAHLADRNLIALATFKSNLEYQRELDRRAHALPELIPLFHENVTAFDRVWYGLHDVTPEGVEEFAAKVDRIRRQR